MSLNKTILAFLIIALGYNSKAQQWFPMDLNFMNSSYFSEPVWSVYIYDNSIYVGGQFTYVGVNNDTLEANGITIWDDSTGWHVPPTDGIEEPGVVFDFIHYNNRLIAGGALINGVWPNYTGVLAYKDTVWDTIGIPNPDGDRGVNVLELYNNQLYAGGDFISDTSAMGENFACWDGNKWSNIGELNHPANISHVDAMVAGTINGNYRLFVGGNFNNAGSCKDCWNLAQWDGTQWDSINTVYGQQVDAMTIDTVNEHLYISGQFSKVGKTWANAIAVWNGNQWDSLGGGLDCRAFHQGIIMYNGELYVGGCMDQAGQKNVRNIARWNGREWKDVGGGVNAGIATFAIHKDTLWVGGGFNKISDSNYTSISLAKWHTPKCAYLEAGIEVQELQMDGTITLSDSSAGLWIDQKKWIFPGDTVLYGDTITYTTRNTSHVKYVVTYQYPEGTFCSDTAERTFTGIPDKKKIINEFIVMPNPAKDQITIELSFKEIPENAELVITNSNGQRVKAFKLNQTTQTIHYSTKGLAGGVYFATIEQNGQSLQTEKVVLK